MLKLAIPLDFQLLLKLCQVSVVHLSITPALEFTEGLSIHQEAQAISTESKELQNKCLIAKMCIPLRDS